MTKCKERWEIENNKACEKQRKDLGKIGKFLVVVGLDGVFKKISGEFSMRMETTANGNLVVV